MLPTTSYGRGRGQMFAMERLFTSGVPIELSAGEDAAHERAVLKMMQRELAEADEANLLEEEDMHVFDQEPLADHLSLVSCKTCKKPIKESQYMAHTERCRLLGSSEEALAELDGGTEHKWPPRKARRNTLSSQDNHNGIGDADSSQSLEAENLFPSEATIAPGFTVESQVVGPSVLGNLRVSKRIMNFAETCGITSTKIGRLRKTAIGSASEVGTPIDRIGTILTTKSSGTVPNSAGYTESPLSPSKKEKLHAVHSLFTSEELESICGVVSFDSTTCCQRPLTCKIHSESMKRAVIGRRQPFDVLLQEFKFRSLAEHEAAIRYKERQDTVIPVPLATKVYNFRHNHQMRTVISRLFHETLARASCSTSTSPNSVVGEHGVQLAVEPHLPLESAACELQQTTCPQIIQEKVMNQKDKVAPVPGICAKPVQKTSQMVQMQFGGTQLPVPGPSISQNDKWSLRTPSADVGRSPVLRSKVTQASQLIAMSSPGSSLSSIQQTALGSIHAT